MARLALIGLLALSACTPAHNNCGDECRAIVISSILHSNYATPTLTPRDCYATGAHAGVIATCY